MLRFLKRSRNSSSSSDALVGSDLLLNSMEGAIGGCWLRRIIASRRQMSTLKDMIEAIGTKERGTTAQASKDASSTGTLNPFAKMLKDSSYPQLNLKPIDGNTSNPKPLSDFRTILNKPASINAANTQPSRPTTTMKDLLDKLKAAEASKASTDGTSSLRKLSLMGRLSSNSISVSSSVSTSSLQSPVTPKAKEKFSMNLTGPPQPIRITTPSLKPTSTFGGAMSVRDAVRKRQETVKEGGEQAIAGATPIMSQASVASLGQQPLQDSLPQSPFLQSSNSLRNKMFNSLASTHAEGESGTMDAPEELTEGELRWRQHQEHLRHKKEEFIRKYSDVPMHAKITPTARANVMKPRGPDVNVKTKDAATTTADVSTPVVTSVTSTTTTVNEVLDIAELKRRTAERLKQSSEIIMGSKGKNNVKNNVATSMPPTTPAPKVGHRTTVVKEVSIPAAGLSIRDLSSKLSMRVVDVKQKLVDLGELDVKEMKAPDTELKVLDADVVELLVLELGIDVKREAATDIAINHSIKEGQILTPRSPVVCIMGHVDHGKTTLLDTLRRANVAEGEAGGITQKLSAFTVNVTEDSGKVATAGETKKQRSVVFLDTPGHAAFCAMRSHGAAATDLVVLVVAIDDGVRPQTKEALKYAQEAGCSIIVALNKIDKIPFSERKAARARVLAQLVDLGLMVEDFGGDVMVAEVAGKSGEGLGSLVDSLLLQADVLELKAATEGLAEAIVLDAYMEKGKGVIADLLVSWGTLSVGDPIVVGSTFGRVKAMTDDRGNPITTAGPSTPMQLLGLRSVPVAGQELLSVESESKARVIAERREKLEELKKMRMRESESDSNKASNQAEGEEDETSEDGVKKKRKNKGPANLSVILKADGVGTLEALEEVVTAIATRTKDVNVQILGTGIGDVTKSDVERAATIARGGIDADAVAVLGFNIGLADSSTRSYAKEMDIKIVRDTVIYRLEDSLVSTMESLMPKQRVLVKEGSAKVQKVFGLRNKQGTTVAGLIVKEGTLRLGGTFVYRVTRKGNDVCDEVIATNLKRFKDDVNEVQQGNECGLVLDKFKDFEEDDEISCFKIVWETKALQLDERKN